MLSKSSSIKNDGFAYQWVRTVDMHIYAKYNQNRKMQSRYKNYQHIYTDGSKEDSKVGCAVITDKHSNMQRIPDDSSILLLKPKQLI